MFETQAVSLLRLFAATWLLLTTRAVAQSTASLPIESIDLYGSSALQSQEILEEIEAEVLRYAAALETASTNPAADMAALEATVRDVHEQLMTTLGARVPLAQVRISAITNFAPHPPHLNITIDVVEQTDASRRMPFRAAPAGNLDDPGGLLATWSEYMQKVTAMLYAGASLPVSAADCPALHCVAPFDRPELATYLGRFDEGSRIHEDALYAVAEQSANEEQRANAIFMLAHTNDAARLMALLGRAIYDPSEGVRNNALRVMLYMAQADANREYPLRDIVAAFDFPSTSDRNKSGWILVALAASPRYRDAIRREAVPVALRLIRLEQPINHDPAYELLKALSGESFGDRDYAAWERWAAESAQ
jgi:hypothetical protein